MAPSASFSSTLGAVVSMAMSSVVTLLRRSWKTLVAAAKQRFAEPDFKSEITRKQCVEVVEVYRHSSLHGYEAV